MVTKKGAEDGEANRAHARRADRAFWFEAVSAIHRARMVQGRQPDEGMAHQEKLLKDADFSPLFSQLMDLTQVTNVEFGTEIYGG